MENNNIIDVNESDFENKILVESLNKLVIVDFWAPWCGPCKQLTPILEKIISTESDKIILAKINIDENQQIASQLRIQSIPSVFAFKDKQVVDAFQGVISEKEIITFLEKSLGTKLKANFDEFYAQTKGLFDSNKYLEAKVLLEDFIAENSRETKGMCMYLECLLGLNKTSLANDFINSLSDEMAEDDQIKKIIKRLNLINEIEAQPSISKLYEELKKKPGNIVIVFKIADSHFTKNEFENCFETLLKYYPKHKEKVRGKMLNYFEVLGFNHKSSVIYRKKLSSIMFS